MASSTIVAASAGAAALALSSGATAATTLVCPPGVTNPAYCTVTTTPDPTTTVTTTTPTTTTPTTTVPVPPVVCSSPVTIANDAAGDIEDALLQVRAARRTKIRVTVDNTCPGVFNVRVYRRGTSVVLLSGTRTVKGTAQKPAKITLNVTKTGRAYFRRLARATPPRETVRADLRVSYNPTEAGLKTAVKRRVISVGVAGTDR